MNPRHITPLFALALTAACDARADRDYQGESLLHVQGRVVLEDLESSSELVPALAYPLARAEGRRITLVSVEARGEFPSNFQLDVYAPPPAEAIVSGAEDPFLPRDAELAIAYLTAVPADHPGYFVQADWLEEIATSAVSACAAAEPACQHAERWCLDDGQEDCRTLGFPCEWGGECAPVVDEGNPAIILNEDTPCTLYAGLSEHLKIWTRGGFSKDAVFSHLLGLRDDLRPGYNVVALGAPYEHDKDEQLEPEALPNGGECLAEECGELFEEAAFARYNDVHHTSYQSYDDLPDEESDPDGHAAISDELQRYALELAIEAGYDIAAFAGTKLVSDPSTKLQIRIARDVEPLF
jgi:hypothetical protein